MTQDATLMTGSLRPAICDHVMQDKISHGLGHLYSIVFTIYHKNTDQTIPILVIHLLDSKSENCYNKNTCGKPKIMIIKKDRVPLKFLIFAQHSRLGINRFSTADILKFFRDNPVYIGTMMGIGRSVPERQIRSFLRGLPGNISMVLNAIGIVEGSDDYYYRLPTILYKAIKKGILRFRTREKDGNFETQFTNTLRWSEKRFELLKRQIEEALQVFLDRKTQEAKLRDYSTKRSKQPIIKDIVGTGRRVTQYYFEQRKPSFETDRKEHLYILNPTIPYEEMIKPRPTIFYALPKSYSFHPHCPNFVFKTFDDDLEYKDFYAVPFRLFDEEVFKKLKPDRADIYYFYIKKKNDEDWLYYKTGQPLFSLTEYHKLNKVEDISKAPYLAPFQEERLLKYRGRLHAEVTSTLEDKLDLIRKYREADREVNVISYIENLSLAKALRVRQEKNEKTILVVRVDTSYPDLLCVYLEDLAENERFGKSVKALDLLDLFLIRHRVVNNIDVYKERLFEIEAEYDAAHFAEHESPRDNITRSRYIAAWVSNFKSDVYSTQRKIQIPIINIQRLWRDLIKQIEAAKQYAPQSR